MTSYTFTPIGYIRSCFTEKFGIPRQSGLVADAMAQLEICPPFLSHDAFRGLETFSHVWIIFVFHQSTQEGWKATVRPPRLGGNQRMGVFASRSGFRPNPIGQSAVELAAIEKAQGKIVLHLKGIDLLDGTPVLDIKPYLPYSDSLPAASPGYAAQPPAAGMDVLFCEKAERSCQALEKKSYPRLKRLIIDLLALDPRPAYSETDTNRSHGMRLWDLNIKFKIACGQAVVTSIKGLDDSE